jgi:hypothetical protein
MIGILKKTSNRVEKRVRFNINNDYKPIEKTYVKKSQYKQLNIDELINKIKSLLNMNNGNVEISWLIKHNETELIDYIILNKQKYADDSNFSLSNFKLCKWMSDNDKNKYIKIKINLQKILSKKLNNSNEDLRITISCILAYYFAVNENDTKPLINNTDNEFIIVNKFDYKQLPNNTDDEFIIINKVDCEQLTNDTNELLTKAYMAKSQHKQLNFDQLINEIKNSLNTFTCDLKISWLIKHNQKELINYIILNKQKYANDPKFSLSNFKLCKWMSDNDRNKYIKIKMILQENLSKKLNNSDEDLKKTISCILTLFFI